MSSSTKDEKIICVCEINGREYICERISEDDLYILRVFRRVPEVTFMFSPYHNIKVHGNTYLIDLHYDTFKSDKLEIIKDLETIHKEDILINPIDTYYLSFRSATDNFYTSPKLYSGGVKPAK
jgi:hypothetical protein